MLLDLSAAFDMLDHATLLNHLQSKLKITEVVLKWIESYLSDRTQAVVLKNGDGETAMSNTSRLSMGIHQGSVLGPLLFTLFTTPWEIYVGSMTRISICMLMTLSYMHHSLLHLKSRESCMFKINSCVAEISKWMSLNLLRLNEDSQKLCLLQLNSNCLNFFPKSDHMLN